MAEQFEVRNNEAESRFETIVEGNTAFAAYRRDGDRIIFTHTEVSEAMGGRGVASQLVRGALDQVRRQKLTVVPQCAYVAAFIRRNPEYADLVQAQP